MTRDTQESRMLTRFPARVCAGMFSCARSAIAALIVLIAIPASGKKEKGRPKFPSPPHF
jgi:hypothetical protein